MAQAPNLSIQNNFIAGLKTQYTGLNFPENAATDSQNVIYDLIGNIYRRPGMDYETDFLVNVINRSGRAINTYKWNNVGGDGETQIIVVQVGSSLYFFKSTGATITSPLSTTLLTGSIDLTSFSVPGSLTDPAATECQFSDGNGYLFVFHPACDPFYCSFVPGEFDSVTANIINVKTRDFTGVYPEPGSPDISFRPQSLSNEHTYNLVNQGWTDSSGWTTSSFHALDNDFLVVAGVSMTIQTGIVTFTGVGSGVSGITVNDPVSISSGGSIFWVNGGVNYSGTFSLTGSGVVTAYSGTSLTINVTTTSTYSVGAGTIGALAGITWNFSKNSSITNTIGVWNAALFNYPSNADIWYSFKTSSDVFDPASTIGNVGLTTTPAPKGHFITSAFNQNKSSVSGIANLTSTVTFKRPRVGCWFQGRVWYAGVDDSQNATGDAPFYTWTENLYFSQIVTDITQAGNCFQQNDPTDENFSDLLPSDGGTATIQGCGAVYKLFPVQNGLIVFAANGIWFITGSQGIGFSATDYTITKISGIQSISSNSYIDVMGYPIFWNEEGIYAVTPGTNGILQVENVALNSILDFYADIPLQSKKYARGDYNPIDYEIQWCFRSTNESSVTDRYQFDRILVYNVRNKSFYYHTISNGATAPWIHDIRYVAGPGGSTSPDPTFKYLTSVVNGATYNFTFSELQDDTNYVDWHTHGDSLNFISYFIAGYNLHGKAFAKWQPVYVYLYLRNQVQNAYKIQGIWDYAINPNSGRMSTVQQVIDGTGTANFGMKIRRHKIRGQGIVFQLKVQSVDGKPFDVMGWSMFEQVNQGV